MGVTSARSRWVSSERKVEADVGTSGSVLMNLDRDGICSCYKITRLEGFGISSVVPVGSGGVCIESRSKRKVLASDFGSVEINDNAIIIGVVESEVLEDRWVGDIDGGAEVSRGVLLDPSSDGVGVDEINDCCFVAITVSELGRTGVP